jgi:hypothetical protein
MISTTRKFVTFLLALFFAFAATATSFQIASSSMFTPSRLLTHSTQSRLFQENTDGVVELADEEEEEAAAPTVAKQVAPFLSQGEISEDAMAMDLSDPKQARVMFYIVLSLLPVLFLVPLMLGSREMIPAEMLPPVELN